MRHVADTTSSLLGLTENSSATKAKLFMQSALVSILHHIDEEILVGACMARLRAIVGDEQIDLLSRRIGSVDADGMLRIADICSILPLHKQRSALESVAPQLGFRYSPNGHAGLQLQALIDAAINGEIVAAAIAGLKFALARGDIDEARCAAIADELTSGNGTAQVNPIFINAVEAQMLHLAAFQPGHPIHILSIGCGRGNNDVQLFRTLSERHPLVNLVLVGFDPHQSIANNPIVSECGGILVNRELAPGESYIDALRAETGILNPVALATERYALHHMHRTLDTLLDDLEDIALISVDHPITEQQRLDLTERTAMIAYDLMSAQVRTARSGGTWIPAAMSNPKVFSILYQREVELMRMDGVILDPVWGKMPPTCVITHPAGRRQPQRIAAE